MRFVWTLVALFALIVVTTLLFVYSGAYDVAATTDHLGLTEWALETTMERSVASRAAGIPVPGDLDSQPRIEAGAAHYVNTCETCHGGPGVETSEFAEGLNPKAPDLADEAEEWSPAELFWITKHGVRMTGMPAFGPTHADEDLWAMVAFVRALPGMSADEYSTLRQEAGSHSHEGGGHSGAEPEGDLEPAAGEEGHHHEEGEEHDH